MHESNSNTFPKMFSIYQLHHILSARLPPDWMELGFSRSLQKKRELVDAGSIADHEIKNDDLVYMCFMKDTGGWEEPSADSLAGLPDQAPESGPA